MTKGAPKRHVILFMGSTKSDPGTCASMSQNKATQAPVRATRGMVIL